MTENGIFIVGSGHAGSRAAQSLRGYGWTGSITLLDGEDSQPYERPPLSKSVLVGETTIENCALFKNGFLEDDIDYMSGVSAVGLSPERRLLTLSNGQIIGYERLLLAPGAQPRPLGIPGADLQGVSYLRTAADATLVSGWMRPGTRMIIIGGGLIGLEAASSAILKGCTVSVIEAGPRLMTRAVPAEISGRIRAFHEDHGVKFVFGRAANLIYGDERVGGVRLDDGTEMDCDVVLACIGVMPRVSLAVAAGLRVENGIAVDRHLRTSDPFIYAAGDACSFDEGNGLRTRLECWKNAEDQGALAARNMLGADELYSPIPWMWSDQYEKTMQIVGHPDRGVAEVFRMCSDGTQLVYHLNPDGGIAGVSGFGSIREVARGVRIGQLMIEKGIRPSVAVLQDATIDLKALASARAA